MLRREDFTTPEWQQLQTAVLATIEYVTLKSPHIYGDYVDRHRAKQSIHQYKDKQDSELIRDLTDFDDYKSPIPEHATKTADSIEGPTLRSLTESVAMIRQRDARAVALFKNLILKIAYNTAKARIRISPAENEALIKISLALEKEPEVLHKKWDPSNPLEKI